MGLETSPDPLQETFLYICFFLNEKTLYGPVAQLVRACTPGGIAQLARAPALQAGGPGFESPCLQKNSGKLCESPTADF